MSDTTSAIVYQFPVQAMVPPDGDQMTANKRHAEEFHSVPILMWKAGWCTKYGCGKRSTYVVHFRLGDSLIYCTKHARDSLRIPESEYGGDTVLAALPIDEKRPGFGTVPYPPKVLFLPTEQPRLETPEEWRLRLEAAGLPIPPRGSWEINDSGVY